MKKVFPYQICHIYLNKTANNFFEKYEHTYLVFWWHTIPLGHLFVDVASYFADVVFKKEIISVLINTIDHYNFDSTLLDKYKNSFYKNDWIRFSEVMDEIFAPFIPQKIISKLPVSVVICTRNRSLSLIKCIDSLLLQHCLPAEIIVVDNAPADDSTQKIAEQFSSVIYCKEMRPGLDFARNAGAKKARYEIVAYVDDDVQVHVDWCYRIWESFTDASIAAVTGLIIASSLRTESQQIFEKYWGFNKGYKEIIFTKKFLKSKVPKVWEIGAGANMAFRKNILEALNYFDERLDVGAAGCSGDSEIWYRMLMMNYTIKYNPLAVACHTHRDTIAQLHKQLFHYMRGSVVAAFIQHEYTQNSGYKKYVYFDLPKYYLLLLRLGFPAYTFRYRTIFTEMKGILAGIKFYYRYGRKPSLKKK